MKTALLPLLCLWTLCACGAREDGTRLHLGLDFRPTLPVGAQGASREFLTNGGDRITLRRAHVTLSSVELFACQTSTAWRWLRALSPVGTAEAHTEGSPRKLGTPHVVGPGAGPGLADAEVRTLGTLHPPPGRYCRAHLVFAPADADAEGLGQGPDMVGKTLRLEGEWAPAGGGAARPFVLESTGVLNADVALEGLELTPEALEASRTLHLAYDRWLEGVDLAAGGDAATERALRNVAGSASAGP